MITVVFAALFLTLLGVLSAAAWHTRHRDGPGVPDRENGALTAWDPAQLREWTLELHHTDGSPPWPPAPIPGSGPDRSVSPFGALKRSHSTSWDGTRVVTGRPVSSATSSCCRPSRPPLRCVRALVTGRSSGPVTMSSRDLAHGSTESLGRRALGTRRLSPGARLLARVPNLNQTAILKSVSVTIRIHFVRRGVEAPLIGSPQSRSRADFMAIGSRHTDRRHRRHSHNPTR